MCEDCSGAKDLPPPLTGSRPCREHTDPDLKLSLSRHVGDTSTWAIELGTHPTKKSVNFERLGIRLMAQKPAQFAVSLPHLAQGSGQRTIHHHPLRHILLTFHHQQAETLSNIAHLAVVLQIRC